MPTPVVTLEVWLADIPWGEADYDRPVVFLGERPNDVFVVARSSTKTERMGEDDFLIDKSHKDFGATGLDDTSYIEAQMIELSPDRFHRQLGVVAGDLRSDFLEWLRSGAVTR